MDKIKEYKILYSSSNELDVLCNQVNKSLANGWGLYGTPFVDASGDTCQAMIFREPL